MADDPPLWGNSGWVSRMNPKPGDTTYQDNNTLYKVNKILRHTTSSCGITSAIFFETLKPAAIKWAVSYFEPDLKEATRLAHSFGDKEKHGRSLLKQIKSMIPVEELEDPSMSGKGLRFAIKLAEFYDRAVWWLFVFGITEQFLFEWSNLAWKQAGCGSHPSTCAAGDRMVGAVGGVDVGETTAVSFWNDNVDPPAFATTGFQVPAGASWSSSLAIQCTPYIWHGHANYGIRCVDADTGFIFDDSGPIYSFNTSNDSAISFTPRIAPTSNPRRIVHGVYCDYPSNWEYTAQNLHAAVCIGNEV